MKLVHSSDWHVGASKFLGAVALPRQIDAINRVYEIARENNVEVIVNAGDVYERWNTHPLERAAFEDLMIEKDKEGFTTIHISGNHDIVKKGVTTLHSLARLKQAYPECLKNTYICVEPQVINTHGALFIALPCDRYAEASRWVKEAKKIDPNLPRVIVAHETVVGSVSETGWKPETGVKVMRLVFDYQAFGDIHRSQRLGKAAYYSGAPLQKIFDSDPNKVVLVVDTDDPDNPTAVPVTGIPRLITINDGEPIPADDFVRVRNIDVKSKHTDLPDNVIKTEFTEPDVDLDPNEDLFDQLDVWAEKHVPENLVDKFMAMASEIRNEVGC